MPIGVLSSYQKRVNYKIYYVIGIHYQADANDNFNNVQSRGT